MVSLFTAQKISLPISLSLSNYCSLRVAGRRSSNPNYLHKVNFIYALFKALSRLLRYFWPIDVKVDIDVSASNISCYRALNLKKLKEIFRKLIEIRSTVCGVSAFFTVGLQSPSRVCCPSPPAPWKCLSSEELSKEWVMSHLDTNDYSLEWHRR